MRCLGSNASSYSTETPRQLGDQTVVGYRPEQSKTRQEEEIVRQQ